jgi:hypothetical protein
MIDFTNARISHIFIHQLGSKSLDEPCQYSASEPDISDEELQSGLLAYLLHPFNQPEYFSFRNDSPENSENEVYQGVSELFSEAASLPSISAQMAVQLFELSVQSSVKPGYFLVAMLEGLILDGENLSGIGIYKMEQLSSFLLPAIKGKKASLGLSYGFPAERPDKACLVLNTLKENGYKVLVVEKGGKADGSSYWRDDFLQVKSFEDGFHHTRNFLTLARSFVSDVLPEEFEVTRTDQIDYLNRSIGYFKSNEQFNEDEFKKDVFNSPEVIRSFEGYKKTYEDASDFTLSSEFEISSPAVKKQSRVFKSVLKLDRNFHIYVHGNRELIEKGVETDGRKFYKIYYTEEN